MLRGSANVIQWFSDTKLSYWAIYKKGATDTGVWIFKSDDQEDVSTGSAIDELRRKIAMLDRGAYTITATDKPKGQPRGFFKSDFEIDSAAASPVSSMPQISGITQEQVEQQIKSALDAYKREQELKELREQLTELKKDKKELEKQINDPWNKVVSAVAPYSEHIIGQIFPKQAQVAGIQTAEVLDDNPTSNAPDISITDEQHAIVENFVQTLIAADPDWTATLVKLTDKIKSSPGVITMVKNFL